MEKNLVSQHKLLTDYSKKAQIKKIILGWVIFLIILAVTRVPEVQIFIIKYAKSSANFIINGLKFVTIPMIIGTVVMYRNKQLFDELALYNTGIAFINTKSDFQCYVEYLDIALSYGKMQQSFYITAKEAGISMKEYAWSEFTQADVLRNNLERYGDWRIK